MYVDDILVSSTNRDGMEEFKQKLKRKCKEKYLGKVKHSLHLESTQENGGIEISLHEGMS